MKNMMKLEIGNSAGPARVILFPYILLFTKRSMVMLVFFLSISHSYYFIHQSHSRRISHLIVINICSDKI